MFSQPSQLTVMGNAASVSKGKKSRKSGKGKNKKLANFIKAVVQGQAEKKEAFFTLASTLAATQTAVVLINGIAQGNTEITRIGDEVKHAYVEINLFISNLVTANTAGPFTGDCGFWAVVLDRQPNGALAAFGDMFDTSIAGSAGLDFRITTKNQNRFKIISRNEWCVGCSQVDNAAQGLFVTGAQPYHIKEFIDLSKLQGEDKSVHFNVGTTNAITAIDTGALLFVVAATTSDADNITTVIGQSKYRFTDI